MASDRGRKKKAEQPDEKEVMIVVRVSAKWRKRLKTYCVTHDISQKDLMIQAAEEYMERNT